MSAERTNSIASFGDAAVSTSYLARRSMKLKLLRIALSSSIISIMVTNLLFFWKYL
jgi:hypothetical protein